LDAARVQFAVLRRKSGAQRLQMALSMSDDMRARVEMGVRMRHPEYDDAKVRLAVAKILLGPECFRTVFPGIAIRP
jgi:hypothetical protein